MRIGKGTKFLLGIIVLVLFFCGGVVNGAENEQGAVESISSGTETSYLLDKRAGGLTEEGDPTGDISVLPDAGIFSDETSRLYGVIFKMSMNLSPEIRIATRNREQKYYQRYTSAAERFAPTVDFSVSQQHRYNYDEELSTVTGAGDEPDYVDDDDITEWSFDLDLPLYDRSASVSHDIAQRELEVADNNLAISINQLDAKLHELLGNYMVAVYRLLNLENSVVLSTEHVARIRRGYELRDQTRLALLRAQANLKELEARVDLEQQRKDTALRDFLDFSGIEDKDELLLQLDDLLGSEEQAAGVISSFTRVEDSLGLVETFIDQMSSDELNYFYQKNSYLFRQLQLERELAESRAERFTQDEWPDLSLQADYGREEDTQFNDFETEGTVGIYLAVPIFSGGTLYSTIMTRSEARQLALEQLRSRNRKTFNRLENRRKTLFSLRNVYRKQEINLLQQEEIVRLSIKSFTIKQTSMQDLLTSKNKLIDVKNQLLETAMTIGSQARLFAWELGIPRRTPQQSNQNPFAETP